MCAAAGSFRDRARGSSAAAGADTHVVADQIVLRQSDDGQSHTARFEVRLEMPMSAALRYTAELQA